MFIIFTNRNLPFYLYNHRNSRNNLSKSIWSTPQWTRRPSPSWTTPRPSSKTFSGATDRRCGRVCSPKRKPLYHSSGRPSGNTASSKNTEDISAPLRTCRDPNRRGIKRPIFVCVFRGFLLICPQTRRCQIFAHSVLIKLSREYEDFILDPCYVLRTAFI